MTRKIFAILILLVLCFSQETKPRTHGLKSSKKTVYFGQFQDLPITNFCVSYNGELINVEDASFAVRDNLLLNINILIVDPEKIRFATEENTVLNLKLETKNYKFYQLSLTQIKSPEYKDGYVSSWTIVEKIIDGTVPANTIIIPLNPKNLEITLQNNTNKPSNLALKLPVIRLENKGGQSLKDLMVEGYLKTVALKPFHSKQQVKSNLQNATKISIIV